MELAERFNCRHALKTIPHITLQPPFKTETDRDEMLNVLFSLKETHHAVSISTRGFGSFNERVAFIDVVLTAELKSLQQQVNQLLIEKKMLKTGNRKFHPHITLAHRDLDPAMLPELKNIAGQKSLHMIFEVKSVALLIHQNGKWQIAGEVPLG